ncbi:MAG TPA: Ig-like domain-containing protein [Acidisarcina sp.]
MRLDRGGLLAAAVLGIVLSLCGCGTPGLTAIAVSPATQALSTAGETAQFSAIGTFHEGTSTKDITALVTWKSSDVAVATINSAGLATAVSPGSTTITASMLGVSGVDTGSAVITVSPFIGPALGALTIIPDNQSVATQNETGQFIALGGFGTSAGTTMDLTNLVTWVSSDVQVATITPTGLATGLNNGSTTITAIAKGSDGSVVTATATFTAGPFDPGPPLPALTVYKAGANASTGLVTAPAAGTAAPFVINCGTGPGCLGSFTTGSMVTFTETPGAGSTFGGWSSNCLPVTAPPAPPPTTCTITISGNQAVAAIFN